MKILHVPVRGVEIYSRHFFHLSLMYLCTEYLNNSLTKDGEHLLWLGRQSLRHLEKIDIFNANLN